MVNDFMNKYRLISIMFFVEWWLSHFKFDMELRCGNKTIIFIRLHSQIWVLIKTESLNINNIVNDFKILVNLISFCHI